MEEKKLYVLSIIEKEPILIQFLKSNKIYESFIHNCINHSYNYLEIYNYDPKEDKGMIFHVFQWSKTVEGMDFWSNIIRKYRDLLYEL